jgi:hypothetical protein
MWLNPWAGGSALCALRYRVIAMSQEIVIRLARASENDSIQAQVQAIADETFAYLFAPSQVPIGQANLPEQQSTVSPGYGLAS